MASWNPVGPGIWVREYLFGSNPINTSAVDMGDGRLMVISPGTDVPDEAYAALDELGTVSALVSPGAFHHMGLPAWSERYPDAGLYGPTNAVAHIAKQHPKLKPLQTLEALRSELSGPFDLDEVAGCKQPDLFLVHRDGDQITWFSNELISNLEAYPSNLMFRFAFWAAGNHPGLNINRLAGWLMGARRPEVRAYFEAKLESDPPTRLIPCHGAIIEDAELGNKLREVFARRL